MTKNNPNGANLGFEQKLWQAAEKKEEYNAGNQHGHK